MQFTLNSMFQTMREIWKLLYKDSNIVSPEHEVYTHWPILEIRSVTETSLPTREGFKITWSGIDYPNMPYQVPLASQAC